MQKKTIREQEILELNASGVKSNDIAKKFGVSKQRIWQILNRNNISRNKQLKERYYEIKNRANELSLSGLSVNDIKAKLKIKAVYYYAPEIGLIHKNQRNQRNKLISDEFLNGMSAKKITKLISPKELVTPIAVTSINGVYGINTKLNIRRYPMIGDKSYGGIFEDRKILQYIQKKRDIDKWSFTRISDKLNKLGHKTITGKEFTMSNTLAKYKAYKIKKHKKIRFSK